MKKIIMILDWIKGFILGMLLIFTACMLAVLRKILMSLKLKKLAEKIK